MRIFVNDYDSATNREVTREEFDNLLNDFDREITLCDVETRIDYANLNPQDESLADVLRQIDPQRTVVLHFDSECDIYIEA